MRHYNCLHHHHHHHHYHHHRYRRRPHICQAQLIPETYLTSIDYAHGTTPVYKHNFKEIEFIQLLFALVQNDPVLAMAIMWTETKGTGNTPGFIEAQYPRMVGGIG